MYGTAAAGQGSKSPSFAVQFCHLKQHNYYSKQQLHRQCGLLPAALLQMNV
jgi:hypothetical protein